MCIRDRRRTPLLIYSSNAQKRIDPQDTIFDRLPDSDNSLSWQEQQYVGAGQIVEVSEISHSAEAIQNEMTITLNGASDTIVALAMKENYQNQEVLFEIAKFNDDMTMVFKKPRFDGFISHAEINDRAEGCLLYTSPSPRDRQKSRMPSSA